MGDTWTEGGPWGQEENSTPSDSGNHNLPPTNSGFPTPGPRDHSCPGVSSDADLASPNESHFAPPMPGPSSTPILDDLRNFELPIPYEYHFAHPTPCPSHIPILEDLRNFKLPIPNEYHFAPPTPCPSHTPTLNDLRNFVLPIPNENHFAPPTPSPSHSPMLGNLTNFELPIPNENGTVEDAHAAQLPQEVPLSHEAAQVSISDCSNVQHSMSAQEQSEISHEQSESDDELVTIFNAASSRGILNSRKMPKRPRAPISRRFCCFKHKDMLVFDENYKPFRQYQKQSPSAQLPEEAFFRPLRSNLLAQLLQLQNISRNSINGSRPSITMSPARSQQQQIDRPIPIYSPRLEGPRPRLHRNTNPLRIPESSDSSEENEDVDVVNVDE